MNKEVDRYNNIWEKYNDKYIEELSKYLNIKFPDNLKIINASIGLIPVFPRYLDSFSFALSLGLEAEKITEVAAHETLHFLWFLKWKELYPECPRKEFESPYLIWQYSEMVTDPILNSKEIKPILNIVERAYNSFYTIEQNGIFLMDELKRIYNTNIVIEDKMKNGFEYLKSCMENKSNRSK